jgi:hypothetical protein
MIHINICCLINLFLPLTIPYEALLFGDDELCVVFTFFFFNFHGKHSSDILPHSMIRTFFLGLHLQIRRSLLAHLDLFQRTNRAPR